MASILSRFKRGVSETIKKVEVKTGVDLPGGLTKEEIKGQYTKAPTVPTPTKKYVAPAPKPEPTPTIPKPTPKPAPRRKRTVRERAAEVAKKVYTKADVAVGGYLPGAAPTKEQAYREETKTIKPTETVTVEDVQVELPKYERVEDVGYVPQIKTFAKRVFTRADVGVRERVTKPVYERVGRVTGMRVEEVGDIPAKVIAAGYEYSPAGQITKRVAPKVYETIRGGAADVTESFIESGLTKVRDKPVSVTGEVAAWTAVGPVLGAAGKVGAAAARVTRVSKIPGYAKGVSVAGKAAGVGLATAYTGAVGAQVYKAPEGERAKELGKVLAEDVAPMVAGGVLGASIVKGAEAAKIRRAYEKRPVEEYVLPEVLAGKKTFPESPQYGFKGKVEKLTPTETVKKQQFDVGVFRKRQKAYHATGERFWKKGETVPVGEGGAEVRGIYMAPDVSTYFLRTGKGYKLYGTPKKPGVLEITPKAFETATIARTGKPLKQKFDTYEFTGELKPGVAYPTGIKPEIEAVIPYVTETGLKVSKGKYYFEYKGQPVPIDVAKTVGGRVQITGAKGGVSTYNPLISSSYGGLGAYPVVTPLSAGIGAAKISYRKPAPTSYKPTTVVTYRPTPVAKPKPSVFYPVKAPSYKPKQDYLAPKPSKVVPSYKPKPTVPTYEPSYKPISSIDAPSYKPAPSIPSYKPKPTIPPYKPTPSAPSYRPEPSYIKKPAREPTPERFRGILKVNDFKRKEVAKKKVARAGQAYKVEGKVQKTKKWKQLNTVPLTKARSLDYGSYFSDSTLSAQYRIKKARGTPQKGKLPVPAGYAAKTKGKFREYKIRKGKKVKTPNKFIEKQRKRLDTRGETNKITIYKKMQELKKKAGITKPKKAIKRAGVFGL